MASSSSASRTWEYDIFPSFRGEDVRKGFLSHLLEKFRTKSIKSFIDNGIERSREIDPALLVAIRQSRILIVIFSKNYASSKWCLNELAEIHECYKESIQKVIPIFYEVDPSHVRKQTGKFGKVFEKTCKGKAEDVKQRWKNALLTVADLAGYDSHDWSGEAEAIEIISKDVLNKLLITPSDDFRNCVGIGAHIEAIMDSKLCLESGGVRMVGIWGPSGIGKTTIASALFSRLSSQFEHRVLESYKRTIQDRKVADDRMKLSWAKHFLSVILCQNDLKIVNLGDVEQRLRHMKVLIVLDDVDEVELLETLVGRTGWFGFGSRILVVTQDKALLESHEIDLIYEVEFPSEDLALQMVCWSAFRQNSPPDGFMELAVQVANFGGNLPLALNVLGSSLKKKKKPYWVEMISKLQNGLNGDIQRTLRICYDRLSEKDDQEIFLYIACLFNGESDQCIKNLLSVSVSPSVSISLERLVVKSLIRIVGPLHTVQMHSLLQKLGREIVRAESINNPGKRRFLVDAKDISDVFNDKTGTKKVLGISLHIPEFSEPLSISDESLERMCNLQFIKFHQELWWTDEVRLPLPQGLGYLPPKLRLLHWDGYRAEYIPSNFKAEYLVELKMAMSKLKKLWEGALPLRRLKKLDLSGSRDLKEIGDLSNVTNLEILNLSGCTSLVTLPSSVWNLKKLRELDMNGWSNLEVLPAELNLESLDYLNLRGCSKLRTFPRISRNISRLRLDGTAMEEEDCLWIGNISGLTLLDWYNCPLRCFPSNFHPEHLIELRMTYSHWRSRWENNKLEKLWEGAQVSLKVMDLRNCRNLKEIPDISNATGLAELDLDGCKNLKEIPDLSKAINLHKLDLSRCEWLKEIPDLSNATGLEKLRLYKCKNLKEIVALPKAINVLVLSDCTSLVTLPSSIQHLHKLCTLQMSGCISLEVLPTNINLESLDDLNLNECSRLTSFPQLSTSIERLDLSNTAIEEVPSWIENITGLTELQMWSCEKLRKISATIWNLKHLENADFRYCEGLTSVSDVSLVKTVHAETFFNFSYCFNLDQDAQKFILQSSSGMAVLPANRVPTYFTHQTRGSSLIVPLPQSSLSQQVLRFTACSIMFTVQDFSLEVHWKLRGVTDTHMVNIYDGEGYSHEIENSDHLIVFQFDIRPPEEVHDPPSQLDCNNVEFKFETESTVHSGENSETESTDQSGENSENEYTDQYGESDAETERCNKRMRVF